MTAEQFKARYQTLRDVTKRLSVANRSLFTNPLPPEYGIAVTNRNNALREVDAILVKWGILPPQTLPPY